MSHKSMTPEALDENIFKALGKDWMLLTVKDGQRVNTMTVGWGGIGVMWGKNVVFAVVRPERYSHELLESNVSFSLSAFGENDKKLLAYCGSVSGRNENKAEKCGLTVNSDRSAPYFDEARLTFICRKLYADDLKPEGFFDKALIEKWYGGGYHTLYVAEIEDILIKEN